MKKLLPIFIAAILVVGGGAFYGGMKYAESTRQNFARRNLGGQELGVPLHQGFERQANGGGFRSGQRGGNAGGFTTGEIISKDDKSVTIKLRDGGSKIVFFADSTEIAKSVSGTQNDLEIGKSVVVSGKPNQDGSVTADSIQLRPQSQR
ncbi:MAG: hypothetical protein HY001_00810 [Candidatus Portnoybacteria bacterium]|nr:hypothetical protein [Candidatus Portnoybacteria bacterium]